MVARFGMDTDEAGRFMNSGIRQFGMSLLLATQWSIASREMAAGGWVGSLVALPGCADEGRSRRVRIQRLLLGRPD